MNRLLRRAFRWLYRQVQAATPDSWALCKDYVKADPSVILGSSSLVDVKYRPLEPGVCIEIGADSQIFGSLVIQRPTAHIHIGERTQIGKSSIIAACEIDIGDDVLMAWDVTIMDNDSHSLLWEERKNDVLQCGKDYRTTPEDFSRNKNWSVVAMAPVHIQNKTWIGHSVSILKGVTIGEGAVIGAGSVVTRDVSPYTVVAGNPAGIVRRLQERE